MKLTIDFQVRYAGICETYDLGNKYERKKKGGVGKSSGKKGTNYRI